MNVGFLVPFLALFTLIAACAFAMYQQKKTLERKRDPDAPKSALAADGDPHKGDVSQPGPYGH